MVMVFQMMCVLLFHLIILAVGIIQPFETLLGL